MPLTMPASPGFRSSRFGLETNTLRFESPLSKSVQRVLLGGARWTATYTLPPMNRQQAAEWQAFLLSCEGGVNTFYGFDPDAKTPRGTPTGTPLVNGASQTGSTLTIDGCTANVSNWLRVGDYFGVNGQLYMITSPVNTNGSGQATLAFKPALRGSPADNAAITVSNATCSMILMDDNQTVWATNHNGLYEGITFSAIEIFA